MTLEVLLLCIIVFVIRAEKGKVANRSFLEYHRAHILYSLCVEYKVLSSKGLKEAFSVPLMYKSMAFALI